MKKILLLLLLLGLLTTQLGMTSFGATPSTEEELRGIWVATVYNIDYPSKGTTSPAQLKLEANAILDHAEAMGLNAVFLQVRPTADAFYKSVYFPWSTYLTGQQGLAPLNDFDPLAYWVEEAHKRNLELHAWINPYRITKNTSGKAADAWDSLIPTHIAKRFPEWVKAYNGNLYFNPGHPAVKNLVAAGAMEIVHKYDVDGIHFDDYFYPGSSFPDDDTFNQYPNGFTNKDDWRRNNVNEMVKAVRDGIKRIDKEVSFGISPFGIWANKASHPAGSDTRGNQSYFSHYADSKYWVEQGLVDYINPQIYWNIGFSVADYQKLVDWWSSLVADTDVKLYIGHAAYKTGNSDVTSPWYGDQEIIRQITLNRLNPEVDGSVFFSYRSFTGRPSLMALLTDFYQGAISKTDLIIGLPREDINVTSDHYFIGGSSDPSKPLYMNGNLVPDRSPNGYFGVYVPISSGDNTFTFSQGGKTAVRTITKKTSTWTPTLVTSPRLVTSSFKPAGYEMWQAGEEISFSTLAPIGAEVYVTLGGNKIPLSPATTFDYGGPIYNTTYSGKFTLPAYQGSEPFMDLGAPIYHMNFKGEASSARSAARVYVLAPQASFYGQVTSPVVDTYYYPDSSKGSADMVTQGMVGRITAVTGDYTRLGNNRWIRTKHLKTTTDQPSFALQNGRYLSGSEWDTISFESKDLPLASAQYDGKALVLSFFGDTLPGPLPMNSSLFSKVEAAKKNGVLSYTFTLREGQKINGFMTTTTDKEIQLKVRHMPKVTNTDKPLSGITIMIDPGHGGSDTGALGLLGTAYTEKHINLNTAAYLRASLEARGAKVIMTRASDQYLSLQDRLLLSRSNTPDLFISMHANSIGANRDLNGIKGFSVHYKEELATPVASAVLDQVITNLGRKSRGLSINNFYVVRGTWTPSILLETGFVPNPHEFDYLTSPEGQEALAREIAKGIENYFTK